MKTIDYYMSLPYRLEIIPDPDEGGMQRAIRNFRGVLRSGDLWKLAVVENAEDAKKEWLPAALGSGTNPGYEAKHERGGKRV